MQNWREKIQLLRRKTQYSQEKDHIFSSTLLVVLAGCVLVSSKQDHHDGLLVPQSVHECEQTQE